MADLLAIRGVATFRYQFPYVEKGKKRPDSRATLLDTIWSAVEIATKTVGDLPILAGGKSMGGRMTSLVAAEGRIPRVKGLVFFGFPLHSARKPSSGRGEHRRSEGARAFHVGNQRCSWRTRPYQTAVSPPGEASYIAYC